MVDIKTLLKDTFNIVDECSLRHLDAYMDICESGINVIKKRNDGNDKHHILPKSLFPEYSNLDVCTWNASVMSRYNHIIAHWHIAKATNAPDAWRASFMMIRTYLCDDQSLKSITDIESEILMESGLKIKTFPGHRLGIKHTEEAKLRMSASKIGMYTKEKNPMWGKTPSPESIAMGVAKRIGKTAGKNNPCYGKYGPDHPKYGHTATEDTICNMRMAQRKMSVVFGDINAYRAAMAICFDSTLIRKNSVVAGRKLVRSVLNILLDTDKFNPDNCTQIVVHAKNVLTGDDIMMYDISHDDLTSFRSSVEYIDAKMIYTKNKSNGKRKRS